MSTLTDHINAELDLRLQEMTKEDYVFPKRLQKTDWLLLCLIMIACFLCILGVVLYFSALS